MAQSESTIEEITAGEWAGWKCWVGEMFETMVGPFYFREDEGNTVCAVRVEERHMNAEGAMHGGALAAFADSAIFSLSKPYWIERGAVTVGLNCQYIGPALIGDLIEARATTIRDTPGMLFVTAAATVGDRPILTFAGIIKKKSTRTAAALQT